ncbi:MULTISPECIES: diacylglycerol kinase family protein [unclassified Sporosarcina]|uniref:diacylglycerol/lipid kinase family protein n=1 Tax=unclassified Sporosarcina TaxID=2647733 RepID=UPI000C1647E2|nr:MULTISPECIES: YegS/Rv2252/BmrU family lipid kinase [unclassified Sporosarcina]PIC98085.1 diacylglycerol kinase [Sporosarcina sp. P29]PID04835.1 diacylglycerol kinase [Sporosarcina sp. P30]PID08067.1 diacylglycerol kinase [Sporosarcina sp. P31]PID11175.1 diacylglycerol kinase [Sporosarcina sp. P32b]
MLHFNRALFVYNQTAGEDDTHLKLEKTLHIVAQAVDELIVLNTTSEEQLQQACVKYSDQVDLLIILGGDGTVHTCLNSIAPLATRPIIAILPGGTSNDFSRTLGIPQSLNEAATSILNGSIIDTDIGKVGEHYFMNFWGIGLVTETSENINSDEKKRLGSISYVLSTLRTLNRTEPFHYKIQTTDTELEGDAILLFVLNGRYIGTTQLPIASLSPFDGKLDVLIVRDSNLAAFRELFALQNPTVENEQLNELEYIQVTALEIMQPIGNKVDMDGEIYEETAQQITVLPGHLRMIHVNAL